MKPDDRPIARLLRYGAFEKRAKGGWRFGTKVIADEVVDRLISAGVARRTGDRIEAPQNQESAR